MRWVSSLFLLLFVALSWMQLLFRFHPKILLSFIVLHLQFARNLVIALKMAPAPAHFHLLGLQGNKLVLFFSDDLQVAGRSACWWQWQHYSVLIGPRGRSLILIRSAPVSSSAVPSLVRSSEWAASARLSGSPSSISCSHVSNLPEAPPRRWACCPHAHWGGLGRSCRCRWGWDQCTWSRSPPVGASVNAGPRQTRSCFLQSSQHHRGLEPTAW